jgi:hypothetical protein
MANLYILTISNTDSGTDNALLSVGKASWAKYTDRYITLEIFVDFKAYLSFRSQFLNWYGYPLAISLQVSHAVA